MDELKAFFTPVFSLLWLAAKLIPVFLLVYVVCGLLGWVLSLTRLIDSTIASSSMYLPVVVVLIVVAIKQADKFSGAPELPKKKAAAPKKAAPKKDA